MLRGWKSDGEDLLPEAKYLVDDEGAVFSADATLDLVEEERNSVIESVEDSIGSAAKES